MSVLQNKEIDNRSDELITVIIVGYNVEKYIAQCLESVLHQTYSCLDVVVVNDGSTDGTASICESYASKDNRIRVIHKPLGGSGSGSARNTGLKAVRGNYVTFVDADDWLEPTAIETLYTTLVSTNTDIAIANFTEFMDDDKTFVFHLNQRDYFQEVYTVEEWFTKQYEGQYALSQCFTTPWGKLYKKELLDTIVYPEVKGIDDEYTTWKIYLGASKIVYMNSGLYCYRQHRESITGSLARAKVFPLSSIEERVTILSLLGYDISSELAAYRWRLELHKQHALKTGDMQTYYTCFHKLSILEQHNR